MTAKPFLKWAGGKTSSLPAILASLPPTIGTYYEPFLGGGAVFFALAAENRFDRAMIGDSNVELMLTCQALARHTKAVIDTLEKLAARHVEDFYYKVRASAPKTMIERAARLIYLNKTCFNGLYRVNKKGGFNVPFGDYVNPTICDVEGLRAAAKALSFADMAAGDFEERVSSAKRGDAVYFDPPYVPVSDTANFTAYSKGGFTRDDQERLRNVAEKLVGRGVHVLLSNSDTPLVRELYCSFKLEKLQVRRNINSKGEKRGKVGELLITGRRL